MPNEHIQQYNQWKASAPEYAKMTRDQKKAKMLEFKRGILSKSGPERNVERAISQQQEQGNIPAADRLRAMKKGPEEFRKESLSQGVQSLPYGERYTAAGFDMPSGMAQTLETGFPKTMQSIGKGESFNPAAATSDALSVGPTAYLEAGMGLADFATGGGMDKKNIREGLPYKMITDPSTVAAGITGKLGADAAAYGLSKLGGKLGFNLANKGMSVTPAMTAEGFGAGGMMERVGGSGAIPRAIQKGVGMMGEQLPASLVGGLDGESSVGGEMALAGAIGTTLPVVKGIAPSAKEFMVDFLSETSNRSKALLRKVGGKEAKQFAKRKLYGDLTPDETLKELVNFEDNAKGIAEDIVSTVDDFDNIYMKNNKVIGEAMDAIGDVDAKPLLDKIDQMKIPVPRDGIGFTEEKAVNDMLDGLKGRVNFKMDAYNPEMAVTALEETATGAPKYNFMTGKQAEKSIMTKGRTLPAKEIYNIRKDIDKSINWDRDTFKGLSTGDLEGIKKKLRTYIKGGLEHLAVSKGFKEYPKTMKGYHEVLELQDVFSKQLMPRKNDIAGVDRITNWLLRLSSPNKIDQRIFAGQLEKVIGKDLFGKTELLKLSKELRGRLPAINDYKTGAKSFATNLAQGPVGKMAGIAAGSPKVAAPLVGGMDMLEEGLQKYSPIMKDLRTGLMPSVIQGE